MVRLGVAFGFLLSGCAQVEEPPAQPAGDAWSVGAGPGWSHRLGPGPLEAGPPGEALRIGVEGAPGSAWRDAGAGLRGPRRERAAGGLSEWWERAPEGLQHGFTLPAGGGERVIPLAIEGAVPSLISPQEARFSRPRGLQYTYSGLLAWDATGRALPAEMQLRDGALALVVQAEGVSGEITVDPLLTAPSWKGQVDISNAQYGRAVSSAGDVNGDGYDDLLVAASYQSNTGTGGGRVYLHLGTPDGPNPTPAWSVSPQQSGAEAGTALAALGDVNRDGFADFAVAIPKWDNGQTDEGAVWIFHGASAGPSTTPARVLESDVASARFGAALAPAGDVNNDGFADLIVGAPGLANGQSNEGRAYVYLGGSAGIGATPSWTFESNLASANLGSAVVGVGDLDGDRFDDVAVGAPGVSNGQTGEGRVYVFRGQSSGALVLSQQLELDAASVKLGRSLAAGDLDHDGRPELAAGGSQLPGGSNSSYGAMFVFTANTSGTGFVTTPIWQRNGTTHLAEYGTTVAIGDVTGDGIDDLLSGGPGEYFSSTSKGAVYLHVGRLEGLDPHVEWKFGEPPSNASVGTSVAVADVNGDGVGDVLVGAPAADEPETNEGVVYVHFGVGKDPYGLAMSYVDPWADSGGAVATVGDLDGDGFSEVMVATAGSGLTRSDQAGIFKGGPSGIGGAPWWKWSDGLSYSRFGSSLVGEVDVNGDGKGDVVIGGARASGGSGSLYVLLGDGTGVPTTPSWTILGGHRYFGYSLAVADFNGDGYDDMLGGDAYGGSSENGQLWLYLGGQVAPTGFAWSKVGASYEGLGADLRATDLNNDGYADVFMSSNGGLNGSASKIQLFRGTASGLASSAAWTWTNPVSRGKTNALALGDFNGDGRTDLAAGSPGSSLNGFAEGRAQVFYGTTTSTGMPSAPSWTAFMPPARVGFGGAIAALDFNGDGYDDLAVGYAGQSTLDLADGAIYLYYGSPSGLGTTWSWRVLGRTWRHNLGGGLARAGDVNGDGIDDLIASAGGEGNYLFFGFTDADRDGVSAFVDCDDADPTQGMVGPRFRDADGDGFGAERVVATCERDLQLVELGGDCDDANPAVYPWAAEPCDGVDNDCDGQIDEDSTTRWYVDADGDSYGAGSAAISCTPITGRVSRDGDCDDTKNTVRPGATEVCNGYDDDCDGQVDEGTAAPKSWYRDQDGDGVGTGAATVACAAPTGHVATTGDCDDTNPAIKPGATEVCNGVDDDCDSQVDEGAGAPQSWYRDADDDGVGAGAAVQACAAPPGHVATNTDCNDTNPAIKPGALEVCNGVDDNCNGSIDEGAAAPKTWLPDGDGDGYPRATPSVLACVAPSGHILPRSDGKLDCNDGAPSINPGAAERCDDLDNDCDGQVDEAVAVYDWYPDLDGDQHGDRDADPVEGCDAPFTGAVPNGDDCDDALASVHPEASEVCNGRDDDCDGIVDRDAPSWQAWYADADGDGYPSAVGPVEACAAPSGRVTARDDDRFDCADTAPAVNPGATEVCNGRDDDCDNAVDEGAAAPTFWHPDADGDGFAAAGGAVRACVAPSGFRPPPNPDDADCDDASAEVFPGAEEVCNDADDDCDGEADEDLPRTIGWRDGDGDGFGSGAMLDTCDPPVDLAPRDGDCDDNEVAISPGARERCNEVDDDCDGLVDEEVEPVEQWPDGDGDGFGAGAGVSACDQLPGHAEANGDCDDAVPTVFPGAEEVCNEVDDDCDGQVDQGVEPLAQWVDDDGDGFGAGEGLSACELLPGHAAVDGDCDDAVPSVFPGAEEVCNDVDDDCDGEVDGGVSREAWFRDVDGDGFGAGNAIMACGQPGEEFVLLAGDCAVSDPAVFPGAQELCNGIDDDCDLLTDEGEGCFPDTGEPPEEPIPVSLVTGGAGCSSAGGLAGAWMAVLAGALVRRRGRGR